MPWMRHKPTGEIRMIVASPYDDHTKHYPMWLVSGPNDITPDGKLRSGCYDAIMVDESDYESVKEVE